MNSHLTIDPNDPRITRGAAPDEVPVPQHDTYLVLSDVERGKGFVRPLRRSYTHVGAQGPTHELRKLTIDEHERYDQYHYIRYEAYPESESPILGRFWTQKDLENVGRACGSTTTMGRELAETYARDPKFYGQTYCAYCQKHRPVTEFVWAGTTNDRVGS